jgi:dTDP-4-amino-4,6-dideoxygalactose transaminase
MRMEGVQAAILGVKLKYLDTWIDQRRENARIYGELLRNIEEVKIPKEMQYGRHVYHLYVIRVKERQALQDYLNKMGISTGFHYKTPLHLQKAYQSLGYKKGDFPITEKVMDEIISLPMYPELRIEQIEYVVKCIEKFYSMK